MQIVKIPYFFRNIFFGIFSFFVFSPFSPSQNEIQNPDPERFGGDFDKFDEQDSANILKTEKLTLFTGSSSIRLWKSLESDFPKINLINRGFGGAHISDVLHFYDQLFTKYRPQRIVMYCGENDLWSGKPVSQVMNDFRTLWSKIQHDLPATTLIYLSCKPSPSRISKWNIYQSLNLKIKNFSLRDENLTFIDISPTLLNPSLSFYPGLWQKDKLHLNQDGYDRWSEWIRPLLAMN